MFRGFAALIGLTLSLGAASAQSSSALDLGPGSYVYWVSHQDGGTDQFQEKLVHASGDVAIYKNVYDGAEDIPSEFFALFSGFYFITCDSEMPTMDERAANASLSPFEPGNTAKIASEGGTDIVVGEAVEVFLMGADRPAHQVTMTYSEEDGGTTMETVTVLDDMPLTVGILWDDGSRDTAMLVTRSKENSQTFNDPDLIGNCASLLRDPEE